MTELFLTESVWWYVLAGFLLGFILSTLWEWLYFRSRRLRIENRRIAELEARVRSLTPPAGLGDSTIAPGAPPPYQGPGVFLESEQSQNATEAVTTTTTTTTTTSATTSAATGPSASAAAATATGAAGGARSMQYSTTAAPTEPPIVAIQPAVKPAVQSAPQPTTLPPGGRSSVQNNGAQTVEQRTTYTVRPAERSTAQTSSGQNSAANGRNLAAFAEPAATPKAVTTPGRQPRDSAMPPLDPQRAAPAAAPAAAPVAAPTAPAEAAPVQSAAPTAAPASAPASASAASDNRNGYAHRNGFARAVAGTPAVTPPQDMADAAEKEEPAAQNDAAQGAAEQEGSAARLAAAAAAAAGMAAILADEEAQPDIEPVLQDSATEEAAATWEGMAAQDSTAQDAAEQEGSAARLAAAAAAAAGMAAILADEEAKGEEVRQDAAATGPAEAAAQPAPAAPVLASILPAAPKGGNRDGGSLTQAAGSTELGAQAVPPTGIQPGIQRVSGELDNLLTSLQGLIATTDPLLDGTATAAEERFVLVSRAADAQVTTGEGVTGPYAARNLSRGEYAVVRLMQSVRRFGRELRSLYGRE